ncbi:MAG: hypothetical protein GY696_25125 [Gammaproteobacteria bacterium]|nr:hypothetical protein [Gammaproteobacteria bacterium]
MARLPFNPNWTRKPNTMAACLYWKRKHRRALYDAAQEGAEEFNILGADGVSQAVSLDVLDADGTSYTVTDTVLDLDGTPYSVI